jgi:intracellular sulfur oxidation DsrE/DsrF family protein
MHDDDKDFGTRRSLITGMGVAATGLAIGAAGPAAAQQSSDFSPRRHERDAWMGELGRHHRVFIDSSRPEGGMEAMHYAGGILRSHRNDYGGVNEDYGMVVCFRRFSTMLGYDDVVWEKYGEAFKQRMDLADPATGEAYKVNPINIDGRRDLPNLGSTVDKLGAEGVVFAVCRNATNSISRFLSQATDEEAGEIFEFLTANAIPNSRFVPAGIMAATKSQEYGYTLLFAGT